MVLGETVQMSYAVYMYMYCMCICIFCSLRGRDRYVNEEFDLDLTYITERIIAMSFPATGMESAYRNSLKDVAKMLKTKHQENYMVHTCLLYFNILLSRGSPMLNNLVAIFAASLKG